MIILENLSAPHRGNAIFYCWKTTTALVLPLDQVTMEKASQNNIGVYYIAKYVTGSFNSAPYYCKVNNVLPNFNLARSSTRLSDNKKLFKIQVKHNNNKKPLEHQQWKYGRPTCRDQVMFP